MSGTLYGIGVGPGDPELLTLKAARLIGQARIVAYFCKAGGKGRAHAIAHHLFQEQCEEMPLAYPFTTEVPTGSDEYTRRMAMFYEECCTRIGARLEAGEDVSVIGEGDPFFYGSFMHLYVRLKERFACRVVPGVTAMAGCWAEAGVPMVWGGDVFTVLSGTLPEAELLVRLKETQAAVIMKLGRHLPKVRAALEAAGMLRRAVYVEYGTMENQRILPLADWHSDAPYFSLILVPA